MRFARRRDPVVNVAAPKGRNRRGGLQMRKFLGGACGASHALRLQQYIPKSG